MVKHARQRTHTFIHSSYLFNYNDLYGSYDVCFKFIMDGSFSFFFVCCFYCIWLWGRDAVYVFYMELDKKYDVISEEFLLLIVFYDSFTEKYFLLRTRWFTSHCYKIETIWIDCSKQF